MTQVERDRPGSSDSSGGNPFEALRGRFPPGAEPDRAGPRPAEPARAPARGRVVVRREKKGRAGKTVTRVAGLGLAAGALDELAREMKRALGCGATVEGGDLLLQGALTDRAASWLRARGWSEVSIGN